MTKEIINTWIEIERKLASEHGPFRLFGLFMKEEVWDKWYVLASAPWLDGRGSEPRHLIGQEFTRNFSGHDVVHLSGIQLFDEDHPSVQEVLEEVNRIQRVAEKIDSESKPAARVTWPGNGIVPGY